MNRVGEGWNVTWVRAEGSARMCTRPGQGCCMWDPGSQGSDPSVPSLKMWTSVRQRCVQERTSNVRTPRAVTVVSVLRATNRLRASVCRSRSQVSPNLAPTKPVL